MATENDNEGVHVEDLYRTVGQPKQGFFQKITIPPGQCTEYADYQHPYVVYPLTNGCLDIEVQGQPSVRQQVTAGVPYFRGASSDKPTRVRVCNCGDGPIIIFKG